MSEFACAIEDSSNLKIENNEGILLPGPGDNAPRWKKGERLDHVFESLCLELLEEDNQHLIAVESDKDTFSFLELDARANSLANYLIEKGVGSDDVVALLFDRSPETYVAILAVLKAGAAYVPLDVGFPSERIEFICSDAGASAVLTVSSYLNLVSSLPILQVALDAEEEPISSHDKKQVNAFHQSKVDDSLAYIIYTSGTTGKPKGVPIYHSSIVNFVRVAAECYGYQKGDRVYQGLTLAFDFSVEEIWVPLLAGATLVPNGSGASLVGYDLWQFLKEKQISALCCVPTLLATIEDDLPDLRLLIVSGEACPKDIVRRWHDPNRKILNAYGPTETTVTATISFLEPDTPVTIGVPLSTYTVVILDPETQKPLAFGETGEIAIAGIGLSPGYLGRDDLTQKAFIADSLNIPNNPSNKIYRSGDLGRINKSGLIEYQGRIDTQVKVRGYRIELTEIESVLMQIPGIAQAAVEKYEPIPGKVELVAYYTTTDNVESIQSDEVPRNLREQLPEYMVPAFYEHLEKMPMLASDKVDRKSLPEPSSSRINIGSGEYEAPESKLEEELATRLSEVLQIEKISVTDSFFENLGASSLELARFCADLRKEMGFSSISMRDVYSYTTIRELTQYLSVDDSQDKNNKIPFKENQEKLSPHTPSSFAYWFCGFLQAGSFLAFIFGGVLIFSYGIYWIFEYKDPFVIFERSFKSSIFLIAYAFFLPLIAKWLLIGRFKSKTFNIWGPSYLRFWIVKTLMRMHPFVVFAGTPLYNSYLRMFGAKVGRGAMVYCRPPACPDLIEIGAGAIIGRDAKILGYKAIQGRIVTGAVKIGKGAFMGKGSVMDINTSLGTNAQLAHASALLEGSALPDNKRAHGSPAEITNINYQHIKSRDLPSAFRVIFYSIGQLLSLLLLPVVSLLFIGAIYHSFSSTGALEIFSFDKGQSFLAFFTSILVGSAVFTVVSIILSFLIVGILPRLMWMFCIEGKEYRLLGFRYYLVRTIKLLSNSKFFNLLFGDSVYITSFLSWIGYRFKGGIYQTGSNFGVEQAHDIPFLCEFGRGTMVSDTLKCENFEFSASHFKLSKVKFGKNNFLGNNLFAVPNACIGDNVLIGTKTMFPTEGEMHSNTGLLGSPPFVIPRSVSRDQKFDHYTNNEELRQERIKRKTRHNQVSMLFLMLSRFIFTLVIFCISYLTIVSGNLTGAVGFFIIVVSSLLFLILFEIFLERIAFGFKSFKPQYCSIYDNYFWRHERFWKLSAQYSWRMLNGTPFKPLVWQALGVKIGKKVFDDGASIPEKTLVSIGDNCTINYPVSIQAHSLEDGAFKSDYIKIENNVTLGVNSFVHYGTTVHDNAQIEADSFLMKGETVSEDSTWLGNPAQHCAKL